MPNTNSTPRQLRLMTPVNATEKRQAVSLAKDEGCSVPELVRNLLADRALKRKKQRATAKARKKSASARRSTKPRSSLAGSNSRSGRKPARSNSANNGTGRSATRGASKKTRKRGVVSSSSKIRRGAGASAGDR